MSELLSAAAAALGVPESLVERAAEARAAATGVSVDDILASWAGDAPPPAAAAPAEEAAPAETAPAAEEPAVEEPAVPEIVVEVPAAAPAPAAPAAAPAAYAPPVLVGERDSPMIVLAGAVGLFLVMLLVGLVGPSIQGDAPGARTSAIPYSQPAVAGKTVYQSLGCGSCHTQLVRPVVADVGLGAVTIGDSNQVLGTRRFGPDLSNVGSRLTQAQIEATIVGLGGHPVHRLSDLDMTALVSYLSESRTAEAEGAES